MEIVCLDHPLIEDLLTQLRDQTTPPHRFREAIRKLSVLLFYEAARDLQIDEARIETPLQPARGARLGETLGLVPILRAGLGMVDGILQMVPTAQVWHLGLYRDEETLEAIAYYNQLSGAEPVEVAFVLDPMIATGGTAVRTVQNLKEWGVPRIKLIGMVGSEVGLERLGKAFPELQVYLCAIDPELNEKGYIVPGLGDAGDRQFGTGWGKDV